MYNVMSKLECNDWIPVTVHIRAARYWKKLTLRYFVFLRYILRYEYTVYFFKSPDDLNSSIWEKNNNNNDWGDFVGE